MLLRQTPAPPTLPSAVSCFAEQVLLRPEFSAEVPSFIRGASRSGPPKFRVSSQVSEGNLSLFISSLFENSSATSQQGAIGQVQVQVSLQVSKDVLSEFISSLFANSCCLVTQESPDQVAFSAADTFPSPSPKLLPGVPPEGVSVESDEGVGRESVCGYASASDSYPPAQTSLLHPLLPTSCSRKRDICEDVGEQCMAECCGGFLDPTLASLSPHLSLPPRTFVCDYFDTRNTLSFILTLTSSPGCVSGLWSEGVPPPPALLSFLTRTQQMLTNLAIWIQKFQRKVPQVHKFRREVPQVQFQVVFAMVYL